jgi:hypothetical protein
MLWLIVLILALLAVGGGLAISNLLYLLLLVALAVAVIGAFTGRRTV